jgi:hypothetical protein
VVLDVDGRTDARTDARLGICEVHVHAARICVYGVQQPLVTFLHACMG